MRVVPLSFIVAVGLSLMYTGVSEAQVNSLAAFQDCIGPNGGSLGYGSSCSLITGTYTVPFTASGGGQQYNLTVGRSNIAISGTGGPADTIIRRTSSSVEWLMLDTGGVSNVTVSNLTFDGNRYGAGLNCLAANANYYDLALTQGGNFTVQYVDFINSPASALELGGTSTVSYSNFGWGGYGYGPSGALGQETAQQTATRSTAAYISGTSGGAYYNNIGFAGTAGINLTGDTLYAYGNLLQNNRYEMPDGQGGQIFVDPSSTNARVAGNVINGNYWKTNPSTALATGCQAYQAQGNQTPYGVEAYGMGHGFYNNEIEQHEGSGMVFGGSNPTGQITISSSNPWNSSDPPRYIESNGTGIWFLGTYYGGWTYPTQGVTLDDVLVRNNWGNFGVLLDSVSNYGTYTGFINDSCMSGNTNGNVSSPDSTLSNQTPGNYVSYKGGTCPTSGSQNPALP